MQQKVDRKCPAIFPCRQERGIPDLNSSQNNNTNKTGTENKKTPNVDSSYLMRIQQITMRE
jgi:hypothetical protein